MAVDMSTDDEFKWRQDVDSLKGRLLRAKQHIARGETVLIEKSFAQVVLHDHKRDFCARCLAQADPDLLCDDCGQVVFCSEECMESMQPLHEKECEALEEVELIAKKTGIDLDLLRLLVRSFCARACEQDESKEDVRINDQGETVGGFGKVKQMCHVLPKLSDAWKTSVRNGFRQVLQYLPEEIQDLDEPDELEQQALVLAAQVNENSYSLDAWQNQQVVACVGLFPICAMINHSCKPNCSWFNDGTGKMQVCALRDIQPEEEITSCYIDQSKPRRERREELLATKHFACECERCAPVFDESTDRFLEGVQCPHCMKGILSIQTALDCVDDKSMSVCDSCGHTMSSKHVAMANFLGRDKLGQAKKLADKRDYEQAIALLKPLVLNDQSSSQIDGLRLSTGNGTRMAALRVLAKALGEGPLNSHDVYKCRVLIVKDVLQVLPENHLQVAWAWYDLARALYAMLMLSPTTNMEQSQQDALRQEMLEAYTKSQQVFDYWLPSSHAVRQEIHERLAAINKNTQ